MYTFIPTEPRVLIFNISVGIVIKCLSRFSLIIIKIMNTVPGLPYNHNPLTSVWGTGLCSIKNKAFFVA